MEVSIIVPVKDDAYIFNCLESLLKQEDIKKSDYEIIVVNDLASKVDFNRELKKFCLKNKIKYFRGEKPGASANRNLGISKVKSEKILFIDSDCKASSKWVSTMVSGLDKFDLIEGKIIYDSGKRTLLDRSVENLDQNNKFLTANLGICKKVANSCNFDERFLVFREDTDFGLDALEKGFNSHFNRRAVVYHKKSKFSIKRFVFERQRYIGEPLFFKKHLKNRLIKKFVPSFGRLIYPFELIYLIFLFIFIFYSFYFFTILYLFSGTLYSIKKYLSGKYSFNLYDQIIILLFIPLTMLVKRISIWQGALKFKFFVA